MTCPQKQNEGHCRCECFYYPGKSGEIFQDSTWFLGEPWYLKVDLLFQRAKFKVLGEADLPVDILKLTLGITVYPVIQDVSLCIYVD